MIRILPVVAALFVSTPVLARQPEPPPSVDDDEVSEPGTEVEPEEEPPPEPEPEPEGGIDVESALDRVMGESGAEAEETLDASSAVESEPVAQEDWMDLLSPEAPLVELVREPFRLSPRALLQISVVPYLGEDGRTAAGDPANREGFVLRRARLGVDGTLVERMRYAVFVEFHDSTDAGAARLLEGSFTYTLRQALALSLGVGKVPFSKGWTTQAAFLQLAERPFALRQLDVRPIVPDRQLGGWLSGDLEVANYSLGVFNGSGGLTEGDDNAGVLSAARIELTPLGPTGVTQTAFFPEEVGYQRLRIAAGGDVYFDDGAAGNQLAWSVDLTLKWRGLSLLGEYLRSRFTPDAAPEVPEGGFAGIRQSALYGQAGYFVLPGRAEVVLRVESLDRDLDATSDPGVLAFTGGLNVYFLRHRLKAMASYTHRKEPDAPASAQADNHAAAVLVQGSF